MFLTSLKLSSKCVQIYWKKFIFLKKLNFTCCNITFLNSLKSTDFTYFLFLHKLFATEVIKDIFWKMNFPHPLVMPGACNPLHMKGSKIFKISSHFSQVFWLIKYISYYFGSGWCINCLLPKWFTHVRIILAKGELGCFYTFWTMPIMIFSPIASLMHHPPSTYIIKCPMKISQFKTFCSEIYLLHIMIFSYNMHLVWD